MLRSPMTKVIPVVAAFAVLVGCSTTVSVRTAVESTATQRPTAAAATPGPSPSAAVPHEISRAEAIEIARAALRQLGDDWVVLSARAGPLREARPNWRDYEWGQALPGDLRVWSVTMAAGDVSAQVLVDPADGTVRGSVAGIAN